MQASIGNADTYHPIQERPLAATLPSWTNSSAEKQEVFESHLTVQQHDKSGFYGKIESVENLNSNEFSHNQLGTEGGAKVNRFPNSETPARTSDIQTYNKQGPQ